MVRNRPVYEWIEKHMTGGKAEGADVISEMKRLRGATLPEGMTVGEVNDAFFFPAALFLAGDCGIPTAFGTKGAHIACGENGRHITEEQLKDGAVLDIGAAEILMERGIDVGYGRRADGERQGIFPGGGRARGRGRAAEAQGCGAEAGGRSSVGDRGARDGVSV